MRKAATTWALVIGIDEYEGSSIKRLTGAARDAAAVVGWLRALGVPDTQIFLHAAPSADATPVVDGLGIPRQGCTVREIWQSVTKLSKCSGSRLFVFLSGHGLYEPGSKRIFLTQEATEDAMANMGIDLYSDMFRSWDFPEQFLVMDGCLNQPYSPAVRSSVVAQFGLGVAPKVPRSDTTLTSCFAARHGELALEEDGHGLFMSQFLATLDPARPNPRVVDFDDTDGIIRLDVRRAVLDVVSPTVTRLAWDRYHRKQTPGVSVQGAGEAWPALPIVEIVPQRTATVRILVDPGAESRAVEEIRIDSDDTGWRRWEPVPPADEVQVPIRSVVPVGTRLTVRCKLRPGSSWTAPSMYALTADDDKDFPIQLLAAPTVGELLPTGWIRIAPVVAPGRPFQEVTADQYESVRAATAGLPVGGSVRMTEHESGPVISFRPEDSATASTMAEVVARVLDEASPPDVNAAVISDRPLAPAAVRLLFPPGGAAAVAGFLKDSATLSIGGTTRVVQAAADHPVVPVHPGIVPIELRLPWGAWSDQVQVRDGETRDVTVPAIGVPPLRIRAAVENWLIDQQILSSTGVVSTRSGNTLVLFDDTGRTTAAAADPLIGSPDMRLPAGDPPPGPVRAFTVPSRPGEPPPGTPGRGPWGAGIALTHDHGRVVLPLSPATPILVTLSDGMRAEPLSMQPSRTWDLLVSAGRLDAVGRAEMERLTHAKWSDPLLGLAGAYACLVQEDYRYLDVVLANLRRLEPDLPDIAILRAARLHAEDEKEDVVAPALRKLAGARAVPVFRWGVPLAVNAAHRHGLTGWHNRLAIVDRATISTSIWTMWRQ
jgi:hypothetical protein